MDTRRRLKPQDYTVAWLCALALSEQVAAISMLDELHEDLLQPPGDDNTYTYGSIKGHNIIVACLPLGQPGTISASILVGSLPKSFPNLRIHLLVGIGGGIPHDPPSADPEKDIHLGDVVVGVAEKPGVSGVVQYDFERDHGSGVRELLGSLDKPDRRLLTALGKLFSLDLLGKSNFNLHMERLEGSKMDFTRPTSHEDRLYRSSYGHVDASLNSTGCGSCHDDGLIGRSERLSSHPVVHQGQILSGNAVIKNTPRRDELRRRFPDARCFEMEAAGVMDQTHCLVIRGIADYADSHKNQHWQPYAAGTAAAFAREFLLIIQPQEVTDIDPVASSQTCTQKDPPNPAAFTPDEKACLQSLHFPEMHWRRNDVADPTPSTCAWLLEHPKYCDWLGQGRGMLWIKGKPGAGKSTLLKHALETAERNTTQAVTLASFFFHGRGASLQKNVLGLFRSLLHQILQKDRDLLSKLTSHYKDRCETEGEFGAKWDWHQKQLQSFFKRNVVDAARTHPIRVYIDALDECGEHLATELVEFFRLFAVPISTCFSCRHYPFVALEGGNEICVEQETEKDIESYITTKTNTHIRRFHIAKVIRDAMVSRSNGNFQWVVLVLGMAIQMHKSRNPLVSIEIMIRNIPTELNKLYTTLLNEIDEQERLQSLRLMQWICLAFRPLNLTELRFALAVTADTPHTSIHPCLRSELYVETDEDMERRACHLSKGLVEVKEINNERVAQFVHQSVKDYLLKQGLDMLDDSSGGTVAGRGHFWLSRSCIKYMSMREIQSFATTLDDMSEDELDEMQWADYLAWLNYSGRFWLEHAGEVEKAKIPQDDLLALSCESENSVLFSPLAQAPELNFDQVRTSLLHCASIYGLFSVMNAMLSHMVCVNQMDSDNRTPLSLAAWYGHKDIVEILLNRDDIDVNSKDENGDTPLSLAVSGPIIPFNRSGGGEGHQDIVKMLITRDDVDVNSKNRQGETPLSCAAENGHEAIVKMLLDRDGVDADSKDRLGNTPLSLAAEKGNEAVVKLLLTRDDVDVNSENQSSLTPLSKAAGSGHTSVAKLLLERGLDSNSSNFQLDTAFMEAASHGHCEMMQLLLQKGVHLNVKDNLGRTPLAYAASHGHYHAVKLLFQHNAEIDSKDIGGRTPLSYSISRSSLVIVKLLLQHNAEIDSKDIGGRTPLSHAVSYSSLDVVKLLLQHKADIDSRDSKGRTPLSYAAPRMNVAVVKLLLKRSSNVDQKDEDGRTPFSYAVRFAHKKVVKAFLERRDIDINSKDDGGRSPLSWALLDLDFRNELIVRYLLEQKGLIVTEEDRDLMKKKSKHLGVQFSRTEEKGSEGEDEGERDEESKEKGEEESEEAGSELEQTSKATTREGSQVDSERPRKRIRTEIIVLSD